jgi:hypothetical protein
MSAILVEPTWSYREAAKILDCRYDTLSKLAKRHGVERSTGKPLDSRGLQLMARLLKVEITIARPA